MGGGGKRLKVAFNNNIPRGNGPKKILKKAKNSLLFKGGFSLFKGLFKGFLGGFFRGVKAFGGLINIFSSQNIC